MTSKQIQDALLYAYSLCQSGIYEEEQVGPNATSQDFYDSANLIKDLCYEVEEWRESVWSWIGYTGLYFPKIFLPELPKKETDEIIRSLHEVGDVIEMPSFKLTPVKPFFLALAPDDMKPGDIYEYEYELNEEYPLMSRKRKLIARICHWRYFRAGCKAANALAYGFRGVYSAKLLRRK